MTLPLTGTFSGQPGAAPAPAQTGALPAQVAAQPPAASETFPIATSGDVHVAVSKTARLAMLAEASDVDKTLIATIVSELARNIVKYAQHGVVRVSRHEHAGGIDIDVEAEDSGPGIDDVALALRDHYSTGGTLGLGLPGVRRMADRFTIRSQPHAGTVVNARKRISERAFLPAYAAANPVQPDPAAVLAALPLDADSNPRPPNAQRRYPEGSIGVDDAVRARWDVGSRVRPCVGHLQAGDAVVVAACPDGLLMAIIDVSGHGPGAHAVARQLVDLILLHRDANLVALMDRLQRELKGSIGAAIGLVFVEPALQQLRYLAVGNTRAAKSGNQPWRGISRDGVVGDRMPSPLEQTVALQPGDTLLLWTDGIPELAGREFAGTHALRDAGEIARGLIDRLARPYDDAACVVFKWLR